MVDSRRRRTTARPLGSAAVACAGAVCAAAACAGAAGCSSRPAHPAAGDRAALHPNTAATSAPTPGSAFRQASAGPFSAAKLRGALLTHINGVAAAAPAATGDYASVPDGSAGKQPAGAVRVIPVVCGGATMSGFNPAVLAGSPVAASTFRVGKNGVSEMLVASSAKIAAHALAGQLPAACTHYKETVEGKTFRYTATESTISGIGDQARVLNVRSSGATANDLWSLVYRGAGFVGSVTVVGPNASEAAVRELGEQAYAFAVKSLP
jgi:hypothetical protein